MPRSFDLLVLGEINVDLIVTGDATPIWGQHEKLVDDAQLVAGGSSVDRFQVRPPDKGRDVARVIRVKPFSDRPLVGHQLDRR